MKVGFIFSFLILMSLSLSSSPVYCLDASTNDQSAQIEATLATMSIDQKMGQLLMIGVLESQLTPSLKTRLSKIHPGFLVLFKRNILTPLQTSKFIFDLQNVVHKNTDLQMIVAVDQEGGDVVRIPTSPPLPTALALGRSLDSKNTFDIGYEVGKILKTLGISMNLAPVLDLSDPKKSSFIQTRSFGSDPLLVSQISSQFALGVQSAGVLSTAKHFPGIGSISSDSHKEIVTSPATKDEFFSSLSKPYEKLNQEHAISAVMMTHLVYPNLDSSKMPATFSKEIIGLLREKVHFDGLILTDDIEMAGAAHFKTPEERAVQAFIAGNDVLMVAWNKSSQLRAHKALVRAYRDGKISDERLESSLKKILRAKLSLGLLSTPNKQSHRAILSSLKNDGLKKSINSIFEKVLEEEFSLFAKKDLPVDLSNVLILSYEKKFTSGFSKTFGSSHRHLHLSKKMNAKKIAQDAKNASFVVFNLSGPRGNSILEALPSDVKVKTLVVNSRAASAISSAVDYFYVMNISMRHPDLGAQLGSWFSKEPELRQPSSDK